MTTIAQDNFDADTLGAIAPGFVSRQGTWVVGTTNPVSGARSFGSTTNSDGDVVLYTAAGVLTDQKITFKCVSSGTQSARFAAAILRSDIGYNNCYAIICDSVNTSTINILFYKRVAGTYTLLTTNTVPLVYNAGDVIACSYQVSGSTFSVFLGKNTLPGSANTTFTDSTFTTGYAGIYVNGASPSPLTVDDFVLDNLAAADTTPPVFSSALVASASPSLIQVTMSEILLATSAGIPPASAFTASGGRTVTGVAISGAIAQVTVNTAYTSTDTITVSYTVPGANPRLQDPSNNVTVSFGPSAVTNNTGAAVNNALTNNTANVSVSPCNWDVQASTIKTINEGADFSFLFGGTACTLNFDMTGLIAPYPQISYRVDGYGPWNNVVLAASVVIAMPSDTAGMGDKPGHILECYVKSMTTTQARWVTQASAVKLTGVILDAGKTITAIPQPPLALAIGDSITAGYLTANATGSVDTNWTDAGLSWAPEVGRLLGVKMGVIGFESQGFTQLGAPDVPVFINAYNLLYAGAARTFPASLKFIVLNMGTNDVGNITTQATAYLSALIAATNAATKIIVMQPFNGTHGSELQAAIAACSTPSRCTYLPTPGWFRTANAFDAGYHPSGSENKARIAPLAADSIRIITAGGTIPPVLTSRTVSGTLAIGKDSGGNNIPAANMTLSVSFWDESTNNTLTTARYQSASLVTNSAGAWSFVAQSTLASGGTGYVAIRGAGMHYNAPVVVA